MGSNTYDWTKFDIVFYYNQSIEEVFRFWATSSGLEEFFIEKASYESADRIKRSSKEIAQRGDKYYWKWRHSFSIEGEVLNVINNEEFSFTFGSMKVAIHFGIVGNQTELYLVQTEIPGTEDGKVMGHLNCRSCWIFFLSNLKSILETGQDLRDLDPERVSSMEVGFIPLSAK